MNNKIITKNEDFENHYDLASLQIEIKKDTVNIEDTSSGVYGEEHNKQDFIKALTEFADLLEKSNNHQKQPIEVNIKITDIQPFKDLLDLIKVNFDLLPKDVQDKIIEIVDDKKEDDYVSFRKYKRKDIAKSMLLTKNQYRRKKKKKKKLK